MTWDILGVKLAIDMENLLIKFINQVGALYTESLMGLKGKIKFIALLQAHDMVLEALDQRQVQTEDKSIGMLLIELEHTGLLFAVHNKDFIDEFYVFSCLNFLH